MVRSPDEEKRKRAEWQRNWARANPEAVRAIAARQQAKIRQDPERARIEQDKRNARQRAWRAKNKAHVKSVQRNSYLRTKYGIEPEEYKRLLAEQGGGCAICGSEPEGWKKYLCVDHDHTTGAIRGLLCDPCNRGIGLLGDSSIIVRRALRYLRGTL